jgi:tetratricopeptide (TPR) repeat protein
MLRCAATLALIMLLVPFTTVPASQNDPRLSKLFDRLQSTTDAAEARRINDDIWAIWLDSGDAGLNEVMEEGRRFVGQGKLNLALRNFTSIVKVAPNFAEGWHRRASVYFKMGDFTASITNIREVLALEPHHYGALAGLGLIYIELGEAAAALEALERALAINPHLAGTRRWVEMLRQRKRERRL